MGTDGNKENDPSTPTKEASAPHSDSNSGKATPFVLRSILKRRTSSGNKLSSKKHRVHFDLEQSISPELNKKLSRRLFICDEVDDAKLAEVENHKTVTESLSMQSTEPQLTKCSQQLFEFAKEIPEFKEMALAMSCSTSPIEELLPFVTLCKFSRGLQAAFYARGIKTAGDFGRMMVKEICEFPIKRPKVMVALKALRSVYNRRGPLQTTNGQQPPSTEQSKEHARATKGVSDDPEVKFDYENDDSSSSDECEVTYLFNIVKVSDILVDYMFVRFYVFSHGDNFGILSFPGTTNVAKKLVKLATKESSLRVINQPQTWSVDAALNSEMVILIEDMRQGRDSRNYIREDQEGRQSNNDSVPMLRGPLDHSKLSLTTTESHKILDFPPCSAIVDDANDTAHDARITGLEENEESASVQGVRKALTIFDEGQEQRSSEFDGLKYDEIATEPPTSVAPVTDTDQLTPTAIRAAFAMVSNGLTQCLSVTFPMSQLNQLLVEWTELFELTKKVDQHFRRIKDDLDKDID
ncbi:unnamed protein product [Soboliphyme baturini]|uniref:HECT domain-containing protein n=1 Tax=Soboliphyme baturini TaxID=241478 RepID=A0A183ICV8_9BILA|nr:unnamed protein product [Soboliphyme baturini]